MYTEESNVRYWTERAHQTSGWETTSNDPILRQLELAIIERMLREHSTSRSVIIDLGCGDGYIEANVGGVEYAHWYGLDPTEILIQRAPQTERTTFHIGDAGSLSQFDKPDILFTVRALINIPDLARTLQAIRDVCRPTTQLFFCEGTLQGQARINSARSFFGLPPIVPPSFNTFIDEQLLHEFFDVVEVHHFSSAYYFGSRIVNALVNPHMQQYHDPINLFFKDIKVFGDWGVTRLFHCRPPQS